MPRSVKISVSWRDRWVIRSAPSKRRLSFGAWPGLLTGCRRPASTTRRPEAWSRTAAPWHAAGVTAAAPCRSRSAITTSLRRASSSPAHGALDRESRAVLDEVAPPAPARVDGAARTRRGSSPVIGQRVDAVGQSSGHLARRGTARPQASRSCSERISARVTGRPGSSTSRCARPRRDARLVPPPAARR